MAQELALNLAGVREKQDEEAPSDVKQRLSLNIHASSFLFKIKGLIIKYSLVIGLEEKIFLELDRFLGSKCSSEQELINQVL